MSISDSQARIKADELFELLTSSEEIAVLDVREPVAAAAAGSLLLAVSAPLSRLEFLVNKWLPRHSVPIVTLDGGDDDLAERAATRLVELGYRDVRVLDGGAAGWEEAGYKLHTGSPNVTSQAFGEFVEEVYGTPHITVPELLKKIEAGEEVVLLDSRPLAEFEVHSLPGGTSIPGAELVYRAGEVVPSPDALLVVNCQGRTRSILGAQVLINAGLPNPVVALEGGTMSWLLEGLELEHGKRTAVPLPNGEALELAKSRAAHLAERFGVSSIGFGELEQYLTESDRRTCYVIDVRTPAEFENGHLPGSYSWPSWEVVPGFFRRALVRNARIVLVDESDLVRATVVASWLEQLAVGDVAVLRDGLVGVDLEKGPERVVVAGLSGTSPHFIEVAELEEAIANETDLDVVDLQFSNTYEKSHIPGSSFATRARLSSDLAALTKTGRLVLTSEDGALASLAYAEIDSTTNREVLVLRGGNSAWQAAGLSLENSRPTFLSPPDDFWKNAWAQDGLEAQKAAFRSYLSWEQGLVKQLEGDETVNYRSFS